MPAPQCFCAGDPADEFHSPYVYVGNDPINLVDPDGRQVKPADPQKYEIPGPIIPQFKVDFSSYSDLSFSGNQELGILDGIGLGVGIGGAFLDGARGLAYSNPTPVNSLSPLGNSFKFYPLEFAEKTKIFGSYAFVVSSGISVINSLYGKQSLTKGGLDIAVNYGLLKLSAISPVAAAIGGITYNTASAFGLVDAYINRYENNPALFSTSGPGRDFTTVSVHGSVRLKK